MTEAQVWFTLIATVFTIWMIIAAASRRDTIVTYALADGRTFMFVNPSHDELKEAVAMLLTGGDMSGAIASIVEGMDDEDAWTDDKPQGVC